MKYEVGAALSAGKSYIGALQTTAEAILGKPNSARFDKYLALLSSVYSSNKFFRSFNALAISVCEIN